MKCNQICKWNSNVGCVKPYGVPCILENVSTTDKKATNADRIRAMSDEELAKAIFNWFCVKEHCDMCVPEMRTPKKCNGRCTSGILRWLQQPVEEG